MYQVIPKPSNILGKIGYVFNVYTKKEFRNMGLATRLMSLVICESKKLGVGELYLNATDDGKKVYEKLKFQREDNEMCLKLI